MREREEAERKEQEEKALAAKREREEREAAEKLRSVDINTITPIEAMNLLFELKRILD